MENKYLDKIAHNKLKAILASKNEAGVVIDCTRFAALPPVIQLRCLRTILEGLKGDLLRIGATHLFGLTAILTGGEAHKTLKLPGGIRAEKSYRFLTLTTQSSRSTPAFSYQFDSMPERVMIPEIGRQITFTLSPRSGDEPLKMQPLRACLDAEKTRMPLIIRSVKPGDAFQPLGMKGRKKLQDFLTDEKVPRSERRHVPLVVFGDEVAWVGGMRISHRLRVTGKTRTVLTIEMEQLQVLG